jgi:3'-phosphoadenosine 5'-phosphosulfate sulfotransferase (PAPS reductase)/FAD synthetase
VTFFPEEKIDPVPSASAILKSSIASFRPTYIVAMVSGGKDSAAMFEVCRELGVKMDLIIHGNTRTGIQETTEFVTDQYGSGPVDFAIADAGSAYEDYVMRKGFFGQGMRAHMFSYHLLKAQPFVRTVSKYLRKRRRNIKVMLLAGARKDESDNRSRHLKIMRLVGSNAWVNPIFHWSQDDRDKYLDARRVPINPVAKALCRSGECMCGTMQGAADRAEAAVLYPKWGEWLNELETEVRNLHGFGWGENFPQQYDPNGGYFFPPFQPMCVGCNRRATS